MPAFTADRLLALCPQPTSDRIAKLSETLDDRAEEFGVTTHLRRAHFIAQVAHESGGFKRLSENLNYSESRIIEIFPRLKARAKELANQPEKLANAAYADRLGNGDEASGDGWRYRGQGWIQLTGRDNYRDIGASLGADLVGSPSKASEPVTATLIALTFWRGRRCNDAADDDDVARVTRLINGGLNGFEDRQRLTREAKRIFTDGTELIA